MAKFTDRVTISSSWTELADGASDGGNLVAVQAETPDVVRGAVAAASGDLAADDGHQIAQNSGRYPVGVSFPNCGTKVFGKSARATIVQVTSY